jgi:hypothetical protein
VQQVTNDAPLIELKSKVVEKAPKPPCEDWEKLDLIIKQQERLNADFKMLEQSATSLDQVQGVVESLKQARPAITKLIASLNKASSDYDSAVTSLGRLAKQEAAKALAAAAAASSKAKVGKSGGSAGARAGLPISRPV